MRSEKTQPCRLITLSHMQVLHQRRESVPSKQTLSMQIWWGTKAGSISRWPLCSCRQWLQRQLWRSHTLWNLQHLPQAPWFVWPPKKNNNKQTNKQKTTTNKQTTHLYAVGRKGSQLIITQQLTPVRTAQSKFHAKKSTVDVMFFSQAKVQQQSKKTTSQLVGALSPVNHRGLHQG